MLSIDTNILLPAVDSGDTDHLAAAAFLRSMQGRDDVVISEFILLELYGLLRNPAVMGSPLSAVSAAAVCEAFRAHPRWQLVGLRRTAGPCMMSSGHAFAKKSSRVAASMSCGALSVCFTTA
jgi:predicted nucleic acid-binding protein